MHDLCHHNSVNCMVMLIESDVHCMVMLIDVHCSLSLSIQDGTTPLIAASLLGHVNVVRVLIDAHAHVNQHTKVTELIKAGYSFHSLLFWGGRGVLLLPPPCSLPSSFTHSSVFATPFQILANFSPLFRLIVFTQYMYVLTTH